MKFWYRFSCRYTIDALIICEEVVGIRHSPFNLNLALSHWCCLTLQTSTSDGAPVRYRSKGPHLDSGIAETSAHLSNVEIGCTQMNLVRACSRKWSYLKFRCFVRGRILGLRAQGKRRNTYFSATTVPGNSAENKYHYCGQFAIFVKTLEGRVLPSFKAQTNTATSMIGGVYSISGDRGTTRI